jgi:membrane fusion protein, multidrug efflux system
MINMHHCISGGKARLALIGICCAVLAACGSDSETNSAPSENYVPEVMPEMIFDIADDRAVDFTVETQGVVKPLHELSVQMRVGGYLIGHKIRDGSVVKKGDVIMKLDEGEFELSVTEAQVNLDKALQAYEIEKRSRQTSGASISEAQDRLLRNQYGVTAAELALERARLNKEYSELRAPFDGVIHTQEILTEGMFVGAGVSYGLLLDQGIVSVRLEVLAIEINSIRRGMPVEVDVPGGSRINCSVDAVSPVVDDKTKTGQVTARCNNASSLLKRGMTVNARIRVNSVRGSVRVPRSAVLDRDQRKVVFKLKGNRVEWIYVQPIAMNSQWAVLEIDTITPGDTIAVDRHFTASHDLRVTPRLRFAPVQSSQPAPGM